MTDPVGRRPVDPWQVRICDASGKVLGSGVLISRHHVLTCAHVLGGDDQPPREGFVVDFPRAATGRSVGARVLAGGWFPERDGSQDIAVLEVEPSLPDDIPPARLAHARTSLGRSGLVYGHPAGAADGMWARLEITESVGPRGERMQVGPRLGSPGDFVAPGFSGGGVLDEETSQVVGIIVNTYADGRWVAAGMITCETVAGYWPRLAGLLGAGEPAEPALAKAVLDQVTGLLERYDHLAGPTGRQQIADRLPEAVRSRLPHPPPTTYDLVHACRTAGEVRVLADLVRWFDDRSIFENRLEALLDSLGIPPVRVAFAEPEDLSLASERDLRDALVRLPYFRDARTRHIYLDALQRRLHTELGATVTLPRTSAAVDDATTLLAACRPIRGSLRLLLADFPYGERHEAGFGPLITLIDFLTMPQLLLADEREALLTVLADVDPATLREAYRHAVPWVAGAEPVPAEVVQVVRRVEGLAQGSADLPRILDLAEYLAVRVDGLATTLRAWTDRVAARMGDVDRATVERARTRMRELTPQAEAPVLVIQLAPDALRPADRFLFSAVLEQGADHRVLMLSDEPESVDDLRDRVDLLIQQLYEALDIETDRLTVEVVVPRVLLAEEFDRWEMTEEMRVPIGTKYPVVLRSWDRMRKRAVWEQWGRRWRQAQNQQRPGADVLHYVAPGDPTAAGDVLEALGPDHLTALALGRPLPDDAFTAALQAGVAYLFWVRDLTRADDFRQALDQVLSTTPVRDVPARIAEWRRPGGRSAHPAVAGLGPHVSVMACDYDRRPRPERRELGPPRRRRP